MDKLQTILREYLNKGSEKIDVTMVLALIDQFKKDTKKQLLLHNVTQQRELLENFADWMDKNVNFDGIRQEEINSYIAEKIL